MITVAQLAVEVVGNTEKVNASLKTTNEEVEKSGGLFNGLKGFAGNALSTLMGFVGGQLIFSGLNLVIGQVTSLFSDMADEAGNLSGAEDLLNQRLLSTHDAVGLSAQAIEDLAQHMSDLSGIADSTILQGDNMLLTFTGIGKDVFPQASQAMEDLAVSMNHGKTAGADMQSAAIELGKALNDPLKGMTALQRVGVTFSDQQKQQVQQFMAVGDTADAQRVILNELAKEFGGTAVAAGSTFGGAIDKLKNKLVDFGANVLQKVETWAQPFVTMLADQLPGALDKAGQFLGQIGGDIQNLFKNLGSGSSGFNFGGIVTDMQDFAATVQGQVMPIAQSLSDWFKSDMLPAVQSVEPEIKSFAEFVVNKIVPAFIQFEVYAAKTGGTIAKLLLPIFEKVEPIVVRLGGWLLDMGQKALAFLIPKIEDAAKSVSTFADEMSTRLAPFIKRIGDDITTVAGIIQSVWGTLWPWISALLKFAWDDITGILNIAWQVIQGIFKVGADLLSGNWKQAWADIQDTFQNVWGAIKSFFGNLWGDIQGMAQAGINAFIDLLNHLIDVANKIPGVHISHISHVDFSGGDMTLDGHGAAAGGKQGTQHFASGGIMPYSGMAIVGEHGPEPVFLSAGSRTLSHEDAMQAISGGSGGGGTINLYGPTSDQLMQQLSAYQARQQALTFAGRR